MPYRYLRRTGGAQYHYLYNVGAGNKTIFRSARDYERFLQKIKAYTTDNPKIGIIAYCLTGSSYHLIVEEREIGATAQLIHRLSVGYAMYFNARYKEFGHLFRGPYKEEQIDSNDDLIRFVSRVHAIPQSFKQNPETYRWSSYPDYLKQDATWLHRLPIETYFQDADIPSELQTYINQYNTAAE